MQNTHDITTAQVGATPDFDELLNDPLLANPDQLPDETAVQYTDLLSDERQTEIVGHIINHPECLRVAAQHVTPSAFTRESHQLAAQVAIDYWTEYQKCPPVKYVLAEVKELIKAKKQPDQIRIAAEVGTIGYMEFATPEHISKQIVELQRRFLISKALAKYFKDKDTSTFAKSIAAAGEIALTGNCREKWSKTLDLQESEEWLMPNWLEFGSLAMLSGDPFSGKSHILAEIIAGIVKTGEFARYKIPKCAILLLDAENKRRILVRRLSKALGDGGNGDLDALFSRVDTTKITLPLAVESGPNVLRKLIQEVKVETRQDRVFVIVDTLRSCFAADEMENSEMKAVLYPLQRVAIEENAAILLLHHRPKSGASYSGQTSIAGACDYLWMWESDKDTGIGTLQLKGTRGDHEQKLSFRLEDGKNHWIPDVGADSEATEGKMTKIVGEILKNGELKQEELVKMVQHRWPDGELGKHRARDLITSLVGSVVVTKKGENNATFYSLLG